MSDFKFSCPNCQQSLQATPEYAGMQINCPACQAPIIVPAPAASAAAPRAAGKLGISAAPAHQAPPAAAAAGAAPASTKPRKAKKPRTGLYVGIGVGIAAVVAAILFVPKAIDKYNEHKQTVAAAQVATNPPPELSADEILKKVDDAYKDLKSCKISVNSLSTIDMSQVSPMMKDPIHTTTTMTVLLARGSKYKIEWDRQAGPQSGTGAVWSSGKGDFARTGTKSRKVKNRENAIETAGAMSGALGANLAELFFNQTNSLTAMLKNYSKTNNETVGGHKCYGLMGKAGPQNVAVWIRKEDFLVAKAQLFLGGKMDDSAMQGLKPSQKAQMQMMEKIKGDITETYDPIEVNPSLTDADFREANNGGGATARKKEPRAKE